jgi:hypothetical protein
MSMRWRASSFASSFGRCVKYASTAVVKVMAEQELCVVALRVLADDLREQRHARRCIARQHELAAERREHFLVVRRELLRAAHQLDALRVLLARRVHRGAQHVRFDAPRVQRDRLIERLRCTVEVALLERGAAFTYERGALVFALPGSLRVRDRRQCDDEQRAGTNRRSLHRQPFHAAPRPADTRFTAGGSN